MKTRQVFEELIAMVGSYYEKATQAVKAGNGKLYIPGYMSLEDFLRIVDDPSMLMQTGDNAKEPAYLSIEEGLRGHNADGTEHNGFIVVDVIAREVVAIVDRNGKASFDAANPAQEVLRGRWGGYVVNVKNSKGETFEITTKIGIRGMNVPVTVIIEDGTWNVIYESNPVEIRNVTKITP